MAFVSAAAALPVSAAVPAKTSSFAGRPVAASAAPVRRANIVRMSLLDEKDTSIPQGFTLFSETLNGRAAMVGFFLALSTELINPQHPGIVAQVGSVFSTIQHLF